jgi:hypothetical protein
MVALAMAVAMLVALNLKSLPELGTVDAGARSATVLST